MQENLVATDQTAQAQATGSEVLGHPVEHVDQIGVDVLM